MNIKIINVNKFKRKFGYPNDLLVSEYFEIPCAYFYVGRSKSYGGPSPLRNPYRISDMGLGRDSSIRLYSELLEESEEGCKSYDKMLEIIEKSKDYTVVLGCHCVPLNCHATVIKTKLLDLHKPI